MSREQAGVEWGKRKEERLYEGGKDKKERVKNV